MPVMNGRRYMEGRIVDAQTGEPLPGASITVNAPDGKYLGDGTAANNDGYWSLNSMLYSGNLLTFTNVGYKPVQIDPAELDFYTEIGMQRISTELPPVIVSPKKRMPTWVWIVGAIVVLSTINNR